MLEGQISISDDSLGMAGDSISRHPRLESIPSGPYGRNRNTPGSAPVGSLPLYFIS